MSHLKIKRILTALVLVFMYREHVVFTDPFYGTCRGFIIDQGWKPNTYDITARCSTEPEILDTFYEIPAERIRRDQ